MMNRIYTTFLILILQYLSSANGLGKVRHIQLDDQHLIETGPVNYALVSKDEGGHFEAISVNRDKFLTISEDCKEQVRELKSPSDQESKLISKRDVFNVITSNTESLLKDFNKRGMLKISQNGEIEQFGFKGIDVNFVAIGDTTAIEKPEAFAFYKPNLPGSLHSIYLEKSTCIFVFDDGHVLAKPIACLTEEQHNLIDSVKKEIEQEKNDYTKEMEDQKNKLVAEFFAESKELKRDMESLASELGGAEADQLFDATGKLDDKIQALLMRLRSLH